MRWRGAGIEERGEELWLPFFISWDVPAALHPGAAPASTASRWQGIAWVEVGGDEARLRDWLGDADVPIRVADDGGDRRVRAVAIAVRDGDEIVLRS